MNTKHSTEPWIITEHWPKSYRGDREIVTNAEGKVVVTMADYEGMWIEQPDAARAVECVNALAGVEDPAKAIEAAISILKTLSGYSVGVEYETGPQLDAYDLTEVQQALQLLTPKP